MFRLVRNFLINFCFYFDFHLFAVIYDSFSNYICHNCLASLVSSANFRDKSIENQKFLNSQQNEKEIENEPIEIKKEPNEDENEEIISYEPAAAPPLEVTPDIKIEYHKPNISIPTFDGLKVANEGESFIYNKNRNYCFDDLKAAVELVKFKNKSICATAKLCKVPKSVLFRELKKCKQTAQDRKRGKEKILSDEEELQVKQNILACAEVGVNCKYRDVIKSASLIIMSRKDSAKRTPINLTNGWVRSFMKRHKDISDHKQLMERKKLMQKQLRDPGEPAEISNMTGDGESGNED
jgi:hypothetical protein